MYLHCRTHWFKIYILYYERLVKDAEFLREETTIMLIVQPSTTSILIYNS